MRHVFCQGVESGGALAQPGAFNFGGGAEHAQDLIQLSESDKRLRNLAQQLVHPAKGAGALLGLVFRMSEIVAHMVKNLFETVDRSIDLVTRKSADHVTGHTGYLSCALVKIIQSCADAKKFRLSGTGNGAQLRTQPCQTFNPLGTRTVHVGISLYFNIINLFRGIRHPPDFLIC